MLSNKAIIPLYMNADMLNNLFTIVIQEFVEAKSISTKDAITIHLKTPISELSYELFGKYMQGELDIQIQNEFIKQRTEQSISTLIVIMKQLKDILTTQGLLKKNENGFDLNNVEVNDYVEIPCRLHRNPIIENVINTINMLQIGGTMNSRMDEVTLDSVPSVNDMASLIKREELLSYLKSSLDDHRQQRCIKYIAESIDNPDNKYLVPIKSQSLIDNEDYLLNGRVTILGKVINKHNNNNNNNNNDLTSDENSDLLRDAYSPLYNDAFFDYIDFGKINKLQCPFLKGIPASRNANLLNKFQPKFEILPLVIYI